jgi:hypothetical protein
LPPAITTLLQNDVKPYAYYAYKKQRFVSDTFPCLTHEILNAYRRTKPVNTGFAGEKEGALEQRSSGIDFP